MAAEIVLRLAYPQETLYPRTGFSREYCSIPFANVVMVHARPGRWSYHYTTNEFHHRGPQASPSEASTTRNIVVLGDSYSFGVGVNDGEEYPAVLGKALGPAYGVVNLSAGGWGLTQEIRRFYDLGILYHPSAVILQYCKNDLTDNLNCTVTGLKGDRFTFHDCDLGLFRIKELLSRSLLQKSQLYNLVRDAAYTLAQSRQVASVRTGADVGGFGSSNATSTEEELYLRLLSAFARDLERKGIPLVLLAVNGQLHESPSLEQEVLGLQSGKLLHYYDAAEWMKGEQDYGSPEGHLWGQRAHRIIGERLARMVLEEDLLR